MRRYKKIACINKKTAKNGVVSKKLRYLHNETENLVADLAQR